MQMIRRGSSALRPVVNNEGVRERPSELQEGAKLPGDPLRPMIGMNDRQMLIENRKRIAIQRELEPKGMPFSSGSGFAGQESISAAERGLTGAVVP